MSTQNPILNNEKKLITTIDNANILELILDTTNYKEKNLIIENSTYEKFIESIENKNNIDETCLIIIYVLLSSDIESLKKILGKIKDRKILIGNFSMSSDTLLPLKNITTTYNISIFTNIDTFYKKLSEMAGIERLDVKKHYQIGKSKNIIQEFIETVAPEKEPVFITGETGVGKEYVAQQIHISSKRTGRFIPINCAAITETLAEAELFGHKKGAFSGATTERNGLIKSAYGGTVFFDEFGELPLSIQAKLLRAIEKNEIKPVGADQFETVTDVRYIVATNREIYKDINNKLFRKDLFYRLSVLPLHLPPLRKIKDDICDLVNHFITLHNSENPQNLVNIIPENSNIIKILKEYEWPGNIRQLRNIIKRAIIFKKKGAPDTSLYGEEGNDTLTGGDGNDVLEANALTLRLLVLDTTDIEKSLAKENENESVSNTDPIKRNLSGNTDNPFKLLNTQSLMKLRNDLENVSILRFYYDASYKLINAANIYRVDRETFTKYLKQLGIVPDLKRKMTEDELKEYIKTEEYSTQTIKYIINILKEYSDYGNDVIDTITQNWKNLVTSSKPDMKNTPTP